MNIKNMDYKQYLKTLENKSIDLICIDPPYGKINGMQLSGQKKKIDWDININWAEMFIEFNRVIKDGGTICVFGQNPTYSEMILSNLKNYKYELVWVKNNAAQGFHADKMPLNFTENIAVFIHNENKSNKRTFNLLEKKEIDKDTSFCRWYSQQLLNYIGLTRKKIADILGHRKLEFWFYFKGTHFGLLSEILYNELINQFNIDKYENFISFEQLKIIWDKEREISKNYKWDSNEYSGTLSNVFEISKENEYLHPTQKPVALIEKLILMFTNEGDSVLDCFLGSGTTAIAALKNNRIPFGCELDKDYYSITRARIKRETKCK